MLSRRQTWWELMVSPTRSNECYSLELPGGGELPDSSRLDRLVAVAQPQIGLSIGDQTERGKNEKFTMENWYERVSSCWERR